jgi:hypothetical protein
MFIFEGGTPLYLQIKDIRIPFSSIFIVQQGFNFFDIPSRIFSINIDTIYVRSPLLIKLLLFDLS